MAAAPSTFSSAPSSLAPSLLSMIRKVVASPPTTPPPTHDANPQAVLEHPETHHLPWADKATNDFVQKWYPLTVDVVNRELHAKQAAKAAAAAAVAAAAAAATRKSARQASRFTKAKKPWRALMRGKAAAYGEDSDSDDASSSSSEVVRHRTVGEVEVQVYRNVLTRAAINLLMKGEQPTKSSTNASSSSRAARNPWPGVHSLIQTLFESKHATQVKHPYIAEISSRCDSAGPPQRLDLCLTSSGVQSLLTPVVIQGVEAIVFSLKEALQFTGKVQWDTHLVLVLPGAPEQQFHVDSSRSWFYFTLIFPLSKDPPKAGKTEFWNKKDQPVVPVERGDVLVFDGRRKHRGSANATAKHVRVFLYIAVYSGTDWN